MAAEWTGISTFTHLYLDWNIRLTEALMLPDFLFLGAPKTGSTWFYECLSRHPGIFLPSVKELHFFNERGPQLDKVHEHEDKTQEWYEYHFQSARAEQVIGEVTPFYLPDKVAPRRIYETVPDARLIACLRHPTERAYSDYWMMRRRHETDRTFREVAHEKGEQFIGRGLYGKQLDRYLEYFDREQLLILIHEEVFDAPTAALNDLCSFVGADDKFYRGQKWITERRNAASKVRSKMALEFIKGIATWMRHTKGAREFLDLLKGTGITDVIKYANRKPQEYPEMDPEVRKELDEYYAPTLFHVEEIVGREIKSWRDKMTVRF